MTVPELEQLAKDSGVSSRVGKLITGEKWYFLFSAPAGSLGKLAEGHTVTLRLTTGSTGDLKMKVESIRTEADGQMAVLLSSREYQNRVTLLRQQSADVIWNTIEAIRVPAGAIRVNENGVTGIYCVVGMSARFKPVEVIYTGGDGYVLVRGTSETERTKLRAGDTVIVTAYGLFDGKVVG